MSARLSPALMRAAYARQATEYDALFLEQQRPKILGLAAAAPPEAGPCADLGAGTGLVARLTGRAMLSVDSCAPMLAQAPAPRLLADLWALPLSSAAFAELWCVTALIEPDNPWPALKEMHRALRPGGLLRLSVLEGPGAERVWQGLIALRFAPLDALALHNDRGVVCRKVA